MTFMWDQKEKMSYRTANDHYKGKIRGYLLMSYIKRTNF